jgi:hypothetical protein
MDRDGFWMLVEATNVDVDCEAHAERLSARLARLAPEEIIWFDRQFWQRLAEAYRWDLWGVAYQLNGGCSDDGFVYFRCWLLAQGQATWEAALHEPDSVADHPVVANRSGPDHEWAILECEPILYVTRNAYRTRRRRGARRQPQPAAGRAVGGVLGLRGLRRGPPTPAARMGAEDEDVSRDPGHLRRVG